MYRRSRKYAGYCMRIVTYVRPWATQSGHDNALHHILIKSSGILFYSVLFLSDVDCSKPTLKHCPMYLLLWSVVWFQWQNEHPRSAGPVRESDGNSAGHSRADRPPGAEEADENPVEALDTYNVVSARRLYSLQSYTDMRRSALSWGVGCIG